MASLNTKTFTAAVQDFAAAVEARASGLVDFSVGAIMRAFSEATAAVGLWLQAEILRVLALTRLATSNGSDADSFVADFFGPFATGGAASFSRLQAQASLGDVVFSRITATGQVVIPVGAGVATADGNQRFVVTLDTFNPTFNAALNGYVMADGVASVMVSVQSTTPGAASNVLPATVNTITSAIPGVDTVTNPAAFVNGADAETTAAFSDRFREHILALREATPATILSYVKGLGDSVQAVNVEGLNPDGTTHKGFFYVIVDDGTGSPTSTLLTAATTIIDAHRANGVEFAVIPPTKTLANVTFGTVSSLIDNTPDRLLAIAAVRAYINSLAIGETLIWSRLFQVAYDASPTITSITGLTVNGATADLAAPLPHVIKAGTVSSS